MLLLSVGCAKEAEAPAGPPPEMPPQEVSVVTVNPERVALTKELPGRVASFLTAEVRPQVGGLLLKRNFEEGADVEEGQVLYEIDRASYEVQLQQAKAAMARAEAQLATGSKRSKRVDLLVAQDVVSQQDKDDASGNVRAARAEVLAARAMMDAAKLDLERTSVVSPIRGRVARNAAMPGGLAVPFQTSLAMVTQLDPVYVDLVRSSTELLQLRRDLAEGRMKSDGDTVTVKLVFEDGTPYGHEGKLAFADATVDPATNAVTLRVVFPNPKKELLPGMYVRAVIEEGVMENALLAPQQGVTRTPRGEPMAMVVGAGDKVEPRILTVARTVGDKWLVTGGLEPGARVIVEGLQKAQPGQVVKPVPYVPGGAPGAAPGSQGAPGAGGPPAGGAAPEAPAPEGGDKQGEPDKKAAAPAAPADATKPTATE
jgi:membrane fusion protein (multidrug efflux system)